MDQTFSKRSTFSTKIVEPPTVTSTGNEEYMPTSMVEVLGTNLRAAAALFADNIDHIVDFFFLDTANKRGVTGQQKAARGGQFRYLITGPGQVTGNRTAVIIAHDCHY